MKKIALLSTVLILTGLGCSNFAEITRYNRGSHDQTPEQFARIQDNRNKLCVGMTEQEVINLLGEPQRKSIVLFRDAITWTYTSHSVAFELWTGIHGRAILLIFQDGRLTKISRYLF